MSFTEHENKIDRHSLRRREISSGGQSSYMNIVFLSVLFRHPLQGDKVGGGEISNRKLLEMLAVKHEVCVISAIGHQMWGERINGVLYYDVSALKYLAWLPGLLKRVLAKLLYRWVAPTIMKQVLPDVILCGTQEYEVGTRFRRRRTVPVGAFIRAFENFSSYNTGGTKKKLRRGIKRLIYGDIQDAGINKLDFLLPNSDFIDRLCAKNFSVQSRYTIYPPVTLPKFKSIAAPDGANRCIRNILMVSGARKKGGDLFVRLASHFPEIEFSIIGYVGARAEREAHPANLRVLPWVAKPEELIARSDLVLVPSIWEEPFGRISVEALQCGTPVLVSNIGGLPETVGYQKFLLVEPGDEPAWREKINLCLNCPAEFISANLMAMENSAKYSIANQVAALEKALLAEIDRVSARRQGR